MLLMLLQLQRHIARLAFLAERTILMKPTGLSCFK